MAKDKTSTADTSKAGYPTLDHAFDWNYTDASGQPHPCVLTRVGERQRVSVIVFYEDGPQAVKDITTGTAGEVNTVHRASPAVKV